MFLNLQSGLLLSVPTLFFFLSSDYDCLVLLPPEAVNTVAEFLVSFFPGGKVSLDRCRGCLISVVLFMLL